MYMKRYIILLISFFTLQVQAIETSRHIERIIEQLQCDLPLEGTFMCPSLIERPLYVERQGNVITQIGVRLFSANMRKDLDDIVCDRIERLFLELALSSSVQKQKSLLKEYGVSLLYNGFMLGTTQFSSLNQTLDIITDNATYSLHTERGKITLRIKSSDAVVITMPTDREFLFAYDKKEHEDLLREELSTWNKRYIRSFEMPTLADLEKTDDGCYVLSGEAYMIDSLKNDTYYSVNGNSVGILFDRNYPLKSLQNVFLGCVATEYVDLNVRYHSYDRKEEYCSMSLGNFFGYMQAQGLVFYSSAYTVRNDEVNCILLMHHPLYDYIHMLIVHHDSALFDKKKVVLEGDFYTFIPQHNIKSLFNF